MAEMIEHRVKLTRGEFAAVADGTFRPGDTPAAGPPTARSFTVTDKRGAGNPAHTARIEAARQRDAEQEAKRRGQADFVQQAAGEMFWDAQAHAQNGRTVLADRILATRTELIAGARTKGVLSQ